MDSFDHRQSYRWGENEFIGPSCSQMVDFIQESKKKQTFYANFEGSYNRRTLEINDTKTLEMFIGCSLNYEEYLNNHGNLQKVEMLARKMVNISKRFSTSGMIHYSAIWIYCFDYSRKKLIGIPVFKVYKCTSGEDAVFVDDTCKEFSSFDDFLDYGTICESFMCVPRRGSYTFGRKGNSKVLDLIYIRSTSSRRSSSRDVTTPNPFGQWLLDRINSISSFDARKIMPLVRSLVDGISAFCKRHKKVIILSAIAIALAGVGWGCYTLYTQSTHVTNCFQMFLNSGMDWSKVADVRVSRATHLGISYLSNTENSMQNSSSALNKTSILRNFLDELPINKNLKDKAEEFLNLILNIFNLLNVSENGSSATGNSKLQSEATKKQSQTGNNSESHEIGRFLEQAREESVDDLAEEMMEEMKEKEKEEEEPIWVPVGENFPGKIYVFRDAYFDNINKGLQELFKDFKLQPRHSMVHDVINNEGKILATLYLCNSKSAFLLVPDENLSISSL